MEENNEKLGLLFLFDVIAILIGTFAILFITQNFSDRNLVTLACFFLGIKVLILGIGDITGIARKFWIAAIFIIIAEVLVIGVDYFMSFGVPNTLLLYTAITELVLVICAHFLWNHNFEKTYEAAQERKDWLNGANDEEAKTQDEYDELFASLVTKDGNTENINTEAVNQYLDNGIELNDQTDEKRQTQKGDTVRMFFDDDLRNKLSINEADISKIEENQSPNVPLEEIQNLTNPVEMFDTAPDLAFSGQPIAQDQENEGDQAVKETEQQAIMDIENSPALNLAKDNLTVGDAVQANNLVLEKDNMQQVASELNMIMEEIKASDATEEELKTKISTFKAEMKKLIPITTESDIVETGEVIRDKLKGVIDKQFIVDEVLDDLVKLSKQVNEKIADLNMLEANLNKKQLHLEQKEIISMAKTPLIFEDVDAEEMPAEILLEGEDSEIIIEEGDYELLKNYMRKNPDAVL